jgi:hypothetical protein
MRSCPSCNSRLSLRDVLSSSASAMNLSRRVSDYRFACSACGAKLRLPPSLMRGFVLLWLLPLPLAAWLGSLALPGSVTGVVVLVGIWSVGFPLYWITTITPVAAPSDP